MSHKAQEAETGVECFKEEEEEGVEERRGFCLVEWFMEKKMLSVANGGYLFIYYIYIYIIFLIRVANLKHAVFQYHHNRKESSKEKLKTVQ